MISTGKMYTGLDMQENRINLHMYEIMPTVTSLACPKALISFGVAKNIMNSVAVVTKFAIPISEGEAPVKETNLR